MNEMILLGAGASVEAGVPDTYGMTRKIAKLFRKDISLKPYSPIISFVVGGLLFQQGVKGEDPLQGAVNVEELFNAVQLLAERNTLEAASFVGSWHSMVQELDRARLPEPRFGHRVYELIRNEFAKERRSKWSISSGLGGHDFERVFNDAFERMKDRPGDGEIFSETAESMIRELAKIVWIDQAECVTYLKPLVSLVDTQARLTVATLNYDNGIEQLTQSAGVPCTTGIDVWSRTGSFEPSSSGVFLIKLHGSIDWALDRDQSSEDRPMPHSVIRQVDATQFDKSRFRPAVVFGQRNKLTAEGPFLDLLRAFQHELSRSDILTIVGYSFRDDHVNEYISQWLNQSRERKIRIINPQFDHNLSSYAEQLVRFGGNRVEIFREAAGTGLAKLYSGSIAVEPSAAQPSKVLADPTAQ